MYLNDRLDYTHTITRAYWEILKIIAPARDLGRLWATGCIKENTGVCKMLDRYARNSFIYILPSFAIV